MKPGQTLRAWWSDYISGRLRTPRDIYRAALADFQHGDARMSDRFFDVPQDVHWEAPERLAAPGYFHTHAYLTHAERADWQHADPRLMRWAALFIELARKRGVPLYAHNCFRTEAQQAELVRRGVSRTPYPRSAHNIGEAVDIVHGVFHWELTGQEWALLGVLGRLALDRVNATLKASDKLSLSWGGDWEFYDPAHWEISDYRARVKRLDPGTPVRLTPRAILARYRA